MKVTVSGGIALCPRGPCGDEESLRTASGPTVLSPRLIRDCLLPTGGAIVPWALHLPAGFPPPLVFGFHLFSLSEALHLAR